MALVMARPMRRPGSSFLTFRQRVPADLIGKATGHAVRIVLPAHGADPEHTVEARVGQGEVYFSLRSRDPATAKARQGIVHDYLQRLWASLRIGPRQLTQREVAALAGEWYRSELREWEDQPGPASVWAKFEGIMNSLSDPERLRREMTPFVDAVLAEKALRVDEDSYERLLIAMRNAVRDAAMTLKRRAENDYGPDQLAARYPEWTEAPPVVPPSIMPDKAHASATSLTGLVDGWGKERGPRGKTLAEARRVMGMFRAFLGHEDAGTVTPDDVVRWKDSLVENGGLSPKTINAKYLTPLGTVFNWGVANRRVASNPARGIRSAGKSAPRVRERSFTEAEATTILTAALRAQETPGRNSPETLLARRWVPWLCAYSGARVAEITQLRAQDFRQEKGVWVFTVSPEAGAVKTDMPRIVPVHSDLIRQGLLEVAKAKGEGPLFYAEGRQHHRRVRRKKGERASKAVAPPAPTHPAKTVAGRLSGWVRGIGVKDPNVQPNHAWRHLFMTLCRTYGVAEEARYFIVGHTRRDTGQRYGEAEPNYLARELEKIPAFNVSRGDN